MTAETLLPLLNKVKETGNGQWFARCPAHDDRTPSLSIRELEDGRVLLHCFAGCPAANVVEAAGLNMSDLFPDEGRTTRTPGIPDWKLKQMEVARAREALVVEVFRSNKARRISLNQQDIERAELAAQRVRKFDDILQEARRYAE